MFAAGQWSCPIDVSLTNQDQGATQQAVSTAIDVLSRLPNGLNLANGGDVENLISEAKANYQARQSSLQAAQRSIDFIFEPQDFDTGYDRASGAETNLQELFKVPGSNSQHDPVSSSYSTSGMQCRRPVCREREQSRPSVEDQELQLREEVDLLAALPDLPKRKFLSEGKPEAKKDTPPTYLIAKPVLLEP
ncbi:MAG: NFX1-type zinc finger-containing 1 [Lasallia pustulata]|uniref:NFX1-type zinc finger-containing 1 n=1 Tax=Lasallia pustulata TaxID=136370 RepID=A0A5M8Q093_9LECA|nr:MAG: NFX1-type zinc finger-containing 1 [Lasallia pustulata]